MKIRLIKEHIDGSYKYTIQKKSLYTPYLWTKFTENSYFYDKDEALKEYEKIVNSQKKEIEVIKEDMINTLTN